MPRSAPLFIVVAALVAGCTSVPEHGPNPGALAAAYAESGRWDEAAREIDIAVRSHPRDAALRRQAADIHTSAGNVPRAVAHLEVSIEPSPGSADAWIQLAELETSRKNTSATPGHSASSMTTAGTWMESRATPSRRRLARSRAATGSPVFSTSTSSRS